MADQHDLTPHNDMWGSFVRIIGWSAVAIAAALLLMAFFLL